jgi:hypothetical protein
MSNMKTFDAGLANSAISARGAFFDGNRCHGRNSGNISVPIMNMTTFAASVAAAP